MGPTNIALVKLFKAETTLREAQRRLDLATKNVRLQERKVDDITKRLQTAHTDLTKLQAKSGEQELEARSLEEKIEKLRNQQQNAQTNKEYQTFLVQINTYKVDKGKIEEETLKLMEQIEALQKDHDSLKAQLDVESKKLEEMRSSIDQRVTQLKSEVDAARPARDEAAAAVNSKALDVFEKLADKFDGEAMAPIEKPHPKREEYVCSICNIDLTLDIYNKLHTRDDLVMCPSGNHLLYIPEDLPPEKAVNKPREKKPRKSKSDIAAPVPRQTLANSVVNSVDQEEQEEAETEEVSSDEPQQ